MLLSIQFKLASAASGESDDLLEGNGNQST